MELELVGTAPLAVWLFLFSLRPKVGNRRVHRRLHQRPSLLIVGGGDLPPDGKPLVRRPALDVPGFARTLCCLPGDPPLRDPFLRFLWGDPYPFRREMVQKPHWD